MILDIEKLIAESHKMAAKSWNNRDLISLGKLLPESEDPSVLFKHNWLAIGQAFGLVASSGVGKSSMADQMSFHWSLGDAFLAEPTRPLRISMIQAEDSDRDLQEQRDGMIRGMLSEGYSVKQIEDALKGVAFPTDFIGVQGDLFLQQLTEYQGDCKFDFLFVNPLQRFFGADVSSQEDTSHFCAGLDKILKHKDYGCAMGIVMHTPKFHSGIKDGRQSVDDYAEYAMAGSQEWTAWIRAVINFQKHGTSEDYFDIKASKRGKRLGWKDAEGNPITKRIFKHSDGFIYWQEVIDPEEIAAIPEAPKRGRGASAKERLDVEKSAVTVATQYTDIIDGNPRPKIIESLWDNDHHEHTKADWTLVVDHLFSDPSRYGFVKMIVKESNGKSYPRLFVASNKK